MDRATRNEVFDLFMQGYSASEIIDIFQATESEINIIREIELVYLKGRDDYDDEDFGYRSGPKEGIEP